MMRIRQLEYVHSIVEYHTIREAAKKLYVTEPTISQQIKVLEKQFGFPIFMREGRGIRLTTEGEAIYPYLLSVLNSVERLKNKVASINQPEGGEITFGLVPISTDSHLQTVLSDFYEDYPNIKVNIYESGSIELYNLLQKGEIDIAVTNTSEELRYEMIENGIHCRNLYDSNFTLIAAVDHPLAQKTTISYKDLVNVPLMVYRNGLIQQTIVKLLGTEQNIVYSFVDYNSAINFVKVGLGVSILPL